MNEATPLPAGEGESGPADPGDGDQYFPRSVRVAMTEIGAAATCLPVRIDGGGWETALFVQLAGPEARRDRRIVARVRGAVPLTLETQLIGHENAAVVMLRVELDTVPDDAFAAEILLLPGERGGHFESLKLLTTQTHLGWFFADGDWRIIGRQRHALDDGARGEFADMLAEAVRHDALIRMTGRYDAATAWSTVTARYAHRRRRMVPANGEPG